MQAEYKAWLCNGQLQSYFCCYSNFPSLMPHFKIFFLSLSSCTSSHFWHIVAEAISIFFYKKDVSSCLCLSHLSLPSIIHIIFLDDIRLQNLCAPLFITNVCVFELCLVWTVLSVVIWLHFMMNGGLLTSVLITFFFIFIHSKVTTEARLQWIDRTG